MTLDEIAIAKLLSKRQSIIEIAQAQIKAIDAKIALYQIPRYARPKRERSLSAEQAARVAARKANDDKLMREIAEQRQEQEQSRCNTTTPPESQ